MNDFSAKGHTVRACTYVIGSIRDLVYNPEEATDKIWGIIQNLESVGAAPEDIGSSLDELEQLLQANNISWNEWTALRRQNTHNI